MPNIEKINYCSEKKTYILNHYEKNFEKFHPFESETFHYMDWESKDAQYSRFHVLAENINLHNKSILDVGCGLGDLYKFLQSLDIAFQYSGMDFSSKYIEQCKVLYPEAHFICNDIFTNFNENELKQFDVVFCSGLFNLNVQNNDDLLKYALGCFYEMSCEYVIFNLLSINSCDKEDKYYYFNSSDVINHVSEFPFTGISVIEDYLENDFTFICSKKQNIFQSV